MAVFHRGDELQVAGSEGQLVSLAVMDLDHFKRLNDTYGHKAGDHVLTKCAELLRECAQQSGVEGCFRYGGEEFCLVLPGIGAKAAATIAETYRRWVQDREMLYDGQLILSRYSLPA